MEQRSLFSADTLAPGIVAGLIGGVAIDAFSLAVDVGVLHAVTVEGFFQFVASGAIGRQAYTSPGYAWLGAAVHFAISAMWGAGYAYIAGRTPQVAARPLVSGLVFGFVVYFAMQLVEVPAGIYRLPTPASLGIALVAHCLFFGAPIAFTLRILRSRRARAIA